ncbi:hypothetical protein K435DRAFT_821484 [Dendrothele bispora CBS 962.96]|uniref:PWI domain-containing protein n=1 Tax=Dendrothele bispora (strain CBS 962.96) TaxID=1314807 RepID=A0A4S8LJ79_DENBC|nr:hypothetical protein K435DRAFT_821484 [Dendrothele bispora CBS 962.96]
MSFYRAFANRRSISGGVQDDLLNELVSRRCLLTFFFLLPPNSFKRLVIPAGKPQGFGFADFEDPDDGCANKKLLVKTDEKTKVFLDAYGPQRMRTNRLDQFVKEIHQKSEDATNQGLLDKEKFVTPPHLHHLQEVDLPENQRGLVIFEIAQFRERAAKREREKMRDVQVTIPTFTPPNGPTAREWGRPQQSPTPPQPSRYGKGGMTGLVKSTPNATRPKSDVELEEERREASGIMKLAKDRDRIEMRERLAIWDDDELFCIDHARWRASQARRLEREEASDAKSRKQMDEMQVLANERRKAGLLLDGAPVKLELNVSLATATSKEAGGTGKPEKATVFGQEEEEEEEATKRRKVPLVKLDFSVVETGEKLKEKLGDIRQSVSHDKSKIVIDRKFEPSVKKLMVKYLREMEDDDLMLFVLEHLKDHKGPQKLVEGLEPVLEEEAVELTKSVWRQIIFESMTYCEGLLMERMMVDLGSRVKTQSC